MTTQFVMPKARRANSGSGFFYVMASVMIVRAGTNVSAVPGPRSVACVVSTAHVLTGSTVLSFVRNRVLGLAWDLPKTLLR